MLRLYILRHAKSSWALPGRSDFDRGLNDRGKKDLPKLANAMNSDSYLPDFVYSSPSNRTRLTIDGIKAAIDNFTPTIEYVDNLYSGSLDNYLNALKSNSNANHSIMVVGHNPTCDALASYLIIDGAEKAMQTIAYKYPTGALAVIDLDINQWSDIDENKGYLVDFLLPREL